MWADVGDWDGALRICLSPLTWASGFFWVNKGAVHGGPVEGLLGWHNLERCPAFTSMTQ